MCSKFQKCSISGGKKKEKSHCFTVPIGIPFGVLIKFDFLFSKMELSSQIHSDCLPLCFLSHREMYSAAPMYRTEVTGDFGCVLVHSGLDISKVNCVRL